MISRVFAIAVGVGLLRLSTAGSEPQLSTEEVLRQVTTNAGLCIHAGAGDASLSAQFAKSGKLIVHGLERDSAKVKAARERLQEKGVYGAVAIENWPAKVLPYADNLANVVVSQDAAIPESELLRVLVPNGTAFVQHGSKWTTIHKAWPKEFDEWTHSRHGADGNMVSDDEAVAAPTTVRWIAGPAQDEGGRKWYYDHVLVSANGRNYYMYEREIVARDAFNGALIWRRPVTADVFREVGTEVPQFLTAKKTGLPVKQGARTSKVRPVAVGDKLIVAAEGKLFAMDGVTGEKTAEYGDVRIPREVLVATNTVIVSDTNGVRGFDVATKRKLWETRLTPERIVAGDGKVFCLAGKVIAAIDIQTGTELWRAENAEIDPATTCTYHDGTLVLEMSSWRDDAAGCGVIAYSGEEGKVRWKKEYKPDMTHYKEARAFFARDLVWLQSGANQIVGYDPKTGEEKQTWGSRGKHCSSPLATGRYFIAPECEFTDLESGERSRARMFKSACRLPFIPANGLLYTFPVQCECFPMLRGYMGMTAKAVGADADAIDFERGVAPKPRSGSRDAAEEWPMYRRDVYRSGATAAALKSENPKQQWTVSLARKGESVLERDWADNPHTPGEITAPVAAEGKVFVALPDRHQVVAVDAQSGKRQWTFTAGGRVDLPPTIDDGLCLFGAHDGWIYCLNAADGSLVWRRRAAPHEARIVAYGQIESQWPAPGSVLVENGIAYVTAGRHPMCDQGVHVLGFKPKTGEVVWRKKIDDLTTVITNWYGPTIAPKVKVGLDFEPMDILVRDGDQLAMSRWRFNPSNGDWKLTLGSTNYSARGQSVPRGAWGYGIRQTKLVLPKRAMAFDDTHIHIGGTNANSLILAGKTQVAAEGMTLIAGESKVALKAPVVHDGLIAAYGRVYASTQDGQLICFE